MQVACKIHKLLPRIKGTDARPFAAPWWKQGWCVIGLVHAIDHRPDGARLGDAVRGARDPLAIIGARLAHWRDQHDHLPKHLHDIRAATTGPLRGRASRTDSRSRPRPSPSFHGTGARKDPCRSSVQAVGPPTPTGPTSPRCRRRGHLELVPLYRPTERRFGVNSTTRTLRRVSAKHRCRTVAAESSCILQVAFCTVGGHACITARQRIWSLHGCVRESDGG